MKLSRFKRYFVPAILTWVLCAGLILSWKTSLTTDEGIHMASGYLSLTRGSQRFDPEHPFLFKYLSALPVVLLHPNLPPNDAKLWDAASPITYDSWQESREWTDEWFYKSGNNAKEMLFLSRLASVGVLLALCYLSYYLARLWFGEKVACWTLLFTAFNPTLLAHGVLTNNDVPVALAFLIVVWALWSYWQKPSMKQALWTGLALAAALTTKDSAVALLPIALLWVLYAAASKRVSWKSLGGHTLIVLATIWVGIWTVYLWRSPLDLSAGAGDTNWVLVQIMTTLRAHHINFNKTATALHYILPSNYWKGLFLSLGASRYGRATFIFHHPYGSGVWFYFPILFFLKTQLIALVIGIAGIFLACKTKVRNWQPATKILVLTAVAFGYFSLTSKLNLGIRHISPLIALYSFAAAGALVALQERYRFSQLISGLIAALYILPVPLQFSNLLGFSNELIWNKANTYQYFDDSNLDWGQQAEKLADYIQDTYHTTDLYTNFGWNPYSLQYFGLSPHKFDPKQPLNGLYAVTGTELNDGAFARFTTEKPAYVLDTSTFIYTFRDDRNLVE